MKTKYIDIEYPRLEDADYEAVIVGLMDVRAADAVRVRYDFDRDGWIIEQATWFEWRSDDEEMDEGWQEAAFCPAWQFEQNRPKEYYQ